VSVCSVLLAAESREVPAYAVPAVTKKGKAKLKAKKKKKKKKKPADVETDQA